MLEVLLSLSLSVAPFISAPQDSVRPVRRAAERAAFSYESLLRRRAPSRSGGGSWECDEVIGRFCFHFTEGEDAPAPPEHPDIPEARRTAIARYRAWFSLQPGEQEAVAPLLRYLVEADRASEAVPAARTHAWAAGRTPRSLLLLGMALHEAGDFAGAEAVFDSARLGLPAEERERLDDVGMLLEPRERSVYEDLEGADREAYHARFWAFSDPSLGDGGNERRSAHYARHAWAMILEEAPRAAGMVSWGNDTEEILLRYGRPTSREQIRPRPGQFLRTRLSMVETFDPRAVSFVPPELLTRGVPRLPPPGVRSELERDTVRSSYAPVVLRYTRSLAVQATRFQQGGGGLLLVAGILRPDTVSPRPEDPTGRLVVLDTLGREVSRVPGEVRVDEAGNVEVEARASLEPGSYVYRLEFSDDSGLAGLAQAPIAVPIPTPPGLSDLLIALPGDSVPADRDALRPVADLVLEPGARVLVWAEAAGLTRRGDEARFAVEWWVEPAEPGGFVGRALRWLGRQIGLGGEDEPVRVRWEDARTEQPVPIGFSVDLAGVDPGLYRLALTVTDRATGLAATAERLFRVDPEAEGFPRPR